MIKWLLLGLITLTLVLLKGIPSLNSLLHPSYLTMVIFFAAQAFVLLRVDSLVPEALRVHGSLVKIILRFLSSATFILILILKYDEPFELVIQFVLLYLIYMIFEIGVALTNLRRN